MYKGDVLAVLQSELEYMIGHGGDRQAAALEDAIHRISQNTVSEEVYTEEYNARKEAEQRLHDTLERITLNAKLISRDEAISWVESLRDMRKAFSGPDGDDDIPKEYEDWFPLSEVLSRLKEDVPPAYVLEPESRESIWNVEYEEIFPGRKSIKSCTCANCGADAKHKVTHDLNGIRFAICLSKFCPECGKYMTNHQ